MNGNTLFAIKQIIEEFNEQLIGIPEDTEYDGRIAVKNKKEVNRLHSELDEVYRKAEAFDRILEEMDSAGKTMYKKESLVRYAVDNAFWNIDGIIVDYESGE